MGVVNTSPRASHRTATPTAQGFVALGTLWVGGAPVCEKYGLQVHRIAYLPQYCMGWKVVVYDLEQSEHYSSAVYADR